MLSKCQDGLQLLPCFASMFVQGAGDLLSVHYMHRNITTHRRIGAYKPCSCMEHLSGVKAFECASLTDCTVC